MTTSIQKSALHPHPATRKRREAMRSTLVACPSKNLYTITVNGEDGNYQTYEVEASSDYEADQKAEAIAQYCMIDITFVEVYRIA